MMTKNLVSAACLLFLLSHAAFGQGVQKVQEPEYIGVFVSLDANTGALSPLERQVPEVKVKVKALGFGGGEGYLEVQGEKSPIRFKADRLPSFIVRLASQQVDPLSIIQFFSLESKKGKRRLTVSKVSSMGMSGKSVTNAGAVAFNVAKYGESSFKVTPAQDLPPGEYVLSGQGIASGFCFGIDPADARQ